MKRLHQEFNVGRSDSPSPSDQPEPPTSPSGSAPQGMPASPLPTDLIGLLAEFSIEIDPDDTPLPSFRMSVAKELHYVARCTAVYYRTLLAHGLRDEDARYFTAIMTKPLLAKMLGFHARDMG
jgi:hypothetical protein